MPYVSEKIHALEEQVAALTVERDAARANARILAHSYNHDSRPPRRVLEESLEYPVDPSVARKETP